MSNPTQVIKPTHILAVLRAYYELCKPRVVLLMLLTAIVGMHLAVPGWVPWQPLILGTIGIGLAASSAAALNQLVEHHIDTIMQRTRKRPLPTGQVTTKQALLFAFVLGIASMTILAVWVNPLTAVLTLLSLIGYAIIYTLYLKRATPQNIVIGGVVGAAPPLLGWTAVTGQLDPYALLLVLIIYVWTPPHFWALAIYRYDEYAKANIPMLPVTHGIAFTKINIILYTILLILVSLLPYLTKMSGLIYLVSAVLLGARFLQWSFRLWESEEPKVAMQTFWFSIIYLVLLFVALLLDHYYINGRFASLLNMSG